MGRVDEGVEEFFTKRVLPTDTLNKQDEESITVHEVAPASSVPCPPPPTKTLRRKLGDFFTLKKRRGLKSETSQEGRPKKASIADLIRPLREVARAEKEKDKDKVKEHDKENEKEKMKEHPSAVTGESAVQETPGSLLRGETVPPRRALREGKSQSLILLSGSAAAGTTNARNTSKKQFEGQHSFEQKLHLMLQRIGVSKVQPGETQNQEGEMKKAESEGTIIDSKPEPPPTFTKPRTMSASSVSPIASITSSSPLISFALPPTISTSSTTTTSPTPTDCMNSISASIITHPATPGPADTSVPSTSSSETDTTSTTTTSLNRADITSTTNSATTAAVCSPLMTDSDPPYTDNISTTLTPTTDNSSATSPHLTSPAPSNGRPVQDNDDQPSPEERSSVEHAEKGTADEELAMVRNSEQTEMDESKKVGNSGEKNENENEKPALTSDSKVIIKEVQKESVKPELDTMKAEVGKAEPASGKEDELCSDKGEMEGQKQEEVDK
ncbi:hypothetical protein FQN60_010892 [Etheostoma spectabile]|uniref:CARMIL C-terminal domain-containing protein n=1 Tax=Etheostoma spectabile TaxID=54343 RepID=A0A5J5DQS8_9PERO|nr:hypothetical protein FQN60_010892 [Etheostoma spectabile]